MKNYKAKFFILIASIISGVLISINFNLGFNNRVFQLNAKEYKDATEERYDLYQEIYNLREENSEIRSKMYSYEADDSKHDKVIEDMKSQLTDYSNINGAVAVSGPGIVIEVNDGPYNIAEDTQIEIDRRTLHDSDAALILNELRSAGAEAISLNSYRILGDTGVECDWAFIRFNDNEQSSEAQPFYFYAIGDPEQLETAILSEGSHINKLMIRKLRVKIEKKDEITIPATSRILDSKFMERAD